MSRLICRVILKRMLNNEKALPRCAWLRVFYFHPFQKQAFVGLSIKNPGAFAPGLFLCSGGRIRTSDLWVMSPTSYHCSTPQFCGGCKVKTSYAITKTNTLYFTILLVCLSLQDDRSQKTVVRRENTSNFRLRTSDKLQ